MKENHDLCFQSLEEFIVKFEESDVASFPIPVPHPYQHVLLVIHIMRDNLGCKEFYVHCCVILKHFVSELRL